jgi:hypothetical protein
MRVVVLRLRMDETLGNDDTRCVMWEEEGEAAAGTVVKEGHAHDAEVAERCAQHLR